MFQLLGLSQKFVHFYDMIFLFHRLFAGHCFNTSTFLINKNKIVIKKYGVNTLYSTYYETTIEDIEQVKYICDNLNSLSLKKNRDNEQVFIAEGIKLVGDLLSCFRAKYIVATSEWLVKNRVEADEIIEIESIEEMKKITQLKALIMDFLK